MKSEVKVLKVGQYAKNDILIVNKGLSSSDTTWRAHSEPLVIIRGSGII